MRKPASLAPRIAVIVFGLLVIAFVAWWFTQNRELPRFGGEGSPVATADSARQTGDRVAARDTTAAQPVPTPTPPDTTPVTRPKPQPAQAPPDTTRKPAAGTGGSELVSSDDIQLMEDLVRRFNGWFIIHISSFQTSGRAREEVAFLESREFAAFIVFLDLGPKGKWYRVYAGPFQTREEASAVKKNLDVIPQVRFTRIASIPD
jgi:cell division septation protein DedD